MTFELTGAHLSTSRVGSIEQDSNQVADAVNLNLAPHRESTTIEQEHLHT